MSCSSFFTSFIPITTVALVGNSISYSAVLDSTTSVSVVTFPAGIKST
jgi:hypothetical protein